MIPQLLGILLFKAVVIFANSNDIGGEKLPPDLVIELTDEKWDQIQKGLWLVAFFDKDSTESIQLETNWPVFALKCKELNINVGKVFAPKNPGLYVRFLVTVFPKVFYIKNGVAHEIPTTNHLNLVELIKDQKLNQLKPVNFLSNPFSVQMSLLSHMFVHAVNLYNFENAIVQKFINAPSATDIVFGLTFIIVGTFLGLLMTCAFGLIQIFFMDSKEPEDKFEESEGKAEDKKLSDDEEEVKEEDPSEKSSTIRKRKK